MEYSFRRLRMGIKVGDMIGSEYRVTARLGEGGFGQVVAAVDSYNNQYAVKLGKNFMGDLRSERNAYENVSFDIFGAKAVGIPQLFYYGTIHDQDVLVLERLGPSLADYSDYKGAFSLKTCLMIGTQLITRLQHIHTRGYIHCDIKPDNILTGLAHNKSTMYLVDFGISKRFREPETGEHYKYIRNYGINGTTRYASQNASRGMRPSRRDDLESLAYVLVDLHRDFLPWPRDAPIGSSRFEFEMYIRQAKMTLDLEGFSEGFPGMHEYMKHVRGLGFDERPMYSYLVNLFEEALKKLGHENDGNFDWFSRH